MNQLSKLRRAAIAVLSVLTVCLIALLAYFAGRSSNQAQPPAVAQSAEVPAPLPAAAPEEAPKDSIPELAQSVLYLEVYDGDGSLLGTASGFLIDEKTLVTNYHVIDGACYLSAFTPDYEVSVDFPTLLAYDEEVDLAILRSSHAPDAGIFPLADSDAVRQGDKVYAVGYPLGLANTLSEGIVGAVYDMDTYTLLQISAPISQGNSGGAVLNEAGEAIGVACMYLIDGQNMNYAIASNDVRRLYELRGEELSLEEFYYSAAADVAVEPEPAFTPQQTQPKPESSPQVQPAPQSPSEREPPREDPTDETSAQKEPVFSESDVIARLQGKWHTEWNDKEGFHSQTLIFSGNTFSWEFYSRTDEHSSPPNWVNHHIWSGTYELTETNISFHAAKSRIIEPDFSAGETDYGATHTYRYAFNDDGTLLCAYTFSKAD